MTPARLLYALACAASLVVLALPVQPWVAVPLGPWEAVAVVSYAWSTWLLARNRPLGWWVGLVGVAAYIVVFYRVRLFADVGMQAFYLVTSVRAIYVWLRGGEGHTERSVGRVPGRWLAASAVLGAVGTVVLWQGLVAMRGAVPFWDALATVLSLVAQVYLMGRYVESWYVWIAVDAIYVPLYASRGLYLTALLYAVLLWLAFEGLRTFRRALRAA